MTRVVDVSNSASFEDLGRDEVFFRGLNPQFCSQQEGGAAGVRHHVALSGRGKRSALSESGYFRAKIAHEKPIKGSSILYSIVHAHAVFFEFPEAACRTFPSAARRWRFGRMRCPKRVGV